MLDSNSSKLVAAVVFCIYIFPSTAIELRGQDQGRAALAEHVFGPQVQSGLFEVDESYALRLEMANGQQLISASIAPKHLFAKIRPIWRDGSTALPLSRKRFLEVLLKIQRIKDFGHLLSKGNTGIATNGRTWFVDRYEKAFLERAVLLDLDHAVGNQQTQFFTVYYMHVITGALEDKRINEIDGSNNRYRVKIDGQWFWTSRRDFLKSPLGHRIKIQAAGPFLDSTEGPLLSGSSSVVDSLTRRAFLTIN